MFFVCMHSSLRFHFEFDYSVMSNFIMETTMICNYSKPSILNLILTRTRKLSQSFREPDKSEKSKSACRHRIISVFLHRVISKLIESVLFSAVQRSLWASWTRPPNLKIQSSILVNFKSKFPSQISISILKSTSIITIGSGTTALTFKNWKKLNQRRNREGRDKEKLVSKQHPGVCVQLAWNLNVNF